MVWRISEIQNYTGQGIALQIFQFRFLRNDVILIQNVTANKISIYLYDVMLFIQRYVLFINQMEFYEIY